MHPGPPPERPPAAGPGSPPAPPPTPRCETRAPSKRLRTRRLRRLTEWFPYPSPNQRSETPLPGRAALVALHGVAAVFVVLAGRIITHTVSLRRTSNPRAT